jgi:hypothetical protein
MKIAPIPYCTAYFACDDGTIYSTKQSSDGELRPLKPRPNNNGYLLVSICINKRAKNQLVHRLVMLAFHGPCPKNMVVCHYNHDKHDNRLSNLGYVSQYDNIHQSVEDGRHAHGETSYAKLTTEDVIAIRKAAAKGAVGRHLALKYNVNSQTVYNIIKGRSWTHIPGLN